MACRLLFVDMEGLNDGRAVKTIVPQVSPRKMVCFKYLVLFSSLHNGLSDCGSRIGNRN
jgi:hypothetical protein